MASTELIHNGVATNISFDYRARLSLLSIHQTRIFRVAMVDIMEHARELRDYCPLHFQQEMERYLKERKDKQLFASERDAYEIALLALDRVLSAVR